MKCISGKPRSAWRALSTDRTEHHPLRYRYFFFTSFHKKQGDGLVEAEHFFSRGRTCFIIIRLSGKPIRYGSFPFELIVFFLNNSRRILEYSNYIDSQMCGFVYVYLTISVSHETRSCVCLIAYVSITSRICAFVLSIIFRHPPYFPRKIEPISKHSKPPDPRKF
jgi:hypothetical protein